MHILCAFAAAVEAGPLPGEFADHEFLQTGVGKTSAAHAIARRLARGDPVDLVLLFGVAGAHRGHDRSVGDLCLVETDRLVDDGVATEDGFLSLDALELGDCGPFAMDPRATAQCAAELPDAHRVQAATVSTCSGTDAHAAAMADRSPAALESMEGAAVAWCCAQAGLPMVQLRCVSNFTGDRARGAWDLQAACTRLQAAMRTLLRSTLRATGDR